MQARLVSVDALHHLAAEGLSLPDYTGGGGSSNPHHSSSNSSSGSGNSSSKAHARSGSVTISGPPLSPQRAVVLMCALESLSLLVSERACVTLSHTCCQPQTLCHVR